METAFSADNVYAFLKLLVETGGIHYVDKDHVIRYRADDTPVGVKPNSGSKAPPKAIALYKENMEMDTSKVLLNPFSEYVGYHPERDFFYNYMSGMPGCLIKLMLKAIAENTVSTEKDHDFKTAAVLSKFTDRIDAKLVKEIEKIRACDFGFILYSKEKHVAQFLSALWEEEFEENSKTKLRKSSLMLIRDMVSTLLGVETPDKLTYKATLIGCPQFDAVIHLLVDILERIAPVLEKVLPIDLHIADLKGHLEHIEAYQKAIQWLTTSTASPVKDSPNGLTSVAEVTAPPWSSTATTAGGVPAVSPVIPNPTPVVAPATAGIIPSTPSPMVMTPVTPASSGDRTNAMMGRPVVPTFTVPTTFPAMQPQPTMMSGYPVGGAGFGMPVMTSPMTTMGFGSPSPFAQVTGLPGGF